jgi:hypothetical protein
MRNFVLVLWGGRTIQVNRCLGKQDCQETWQFKLGSLMREERQQATKEILAILISGMPVALQPAFSLEILINFNLNSAILRTARCSLVVSDRFGFPESLTRYPTAIHTFLHHVVPHRHPTPV